MTDYEKFLSKGHGDEACYYAPRNSGILVFKRNIPYCIRIAPRTYQKPMLVNFMIYDESGYFNKSTLLTLQETDRLTLLNTEFQRYIAKWIINESL